MKVTMNEAFQINEIFQGLIEKKLNFNLSYKIMKLITSIEDDISFYNKKIQELLENYAQKDEEGEYIRQGDSIQLQKDKIEDFNKEYQEVQECKIDFPDIKFTLKELSNLEISPKDAYAIKKLIEE